MLISSAWKGKTNIMTLGWHTVMEFSPSRVGCCIFSAHTSSLIERSRECVINIPTYDLIKQVIGIGNTTGAEIDKFENFRPYGGEADEVGAPLIKECYANFEAKLVDSSHGLKIPAVCVRGRQSPCGDDRPNIRRRCITAATAYS